MNFFILRTRPAQSAAKYQRIWDKQTGSPLLHITRLQTAALQRLLEAENDRETLLYGLSRLLNLDPRQNIELADSLGFFDTPQPEVEASINAALADRQEWKALKAPWRGSDPPSTSGT